MHMPDEPVERFEKTFPLSAMAPALPEAAISPQWVDEVFEMNRERLEPVVRPMGSATVTRPLQPVVTRRRRTHPTTEGTHVCVQPMCRHHCRYRGARPLAYRLSCGFNSRSVSPPCPLIDLLFAAPTPLLVDTIVSPPQ